ncbi:MAG: hypothetical protein ABI416_03575, partial [Ginsengibacter sp.]
MHRPDFLTSISRKFILLIAAIIIAIGIVFFIWQKNKYAIVNETIANTIAKKTNNLYEIQYDSIYFDELAGKAYMKNIHIAPDTTALKNVHLADLPYVLLDIKIATLEVTGVKTGKALLGKQMIGDSVLINDVDVVIYFVKPVEKRTKIGTEARMIYDEILDNLKRIQVGSVFINNMNVKGKGFFTNEKEFDVTHTGIQLLDVLIDSAHNFDTSRTLFCKQAAMQIPSFVSYNNNRPELRVDRTIFSGKDNTLFFGDISVNRFETENGDSVKLLHASSLLLKGLKTNEIVNDKDIIVDTITSKYIIIYQPPIEKIKNKKTEKSGGTDSVGFRHVYSIDMKHLSFPKVTFIPKANSGYTLGNIAIKINEVKAGEIIKVQEFPMDYSKEVELSCDKISIKTKDGFYRYTFQNTSINSLQKQLKLGIVIIKPFLGEEAFARKAHFQRDRYDVDLDGIALNGIDMKNLFEKKIIASSLTIDNASIKIYRDLQRPMDEKSKVGNYPSQLLKRIDMPVNISKALVSKAFIEYREKEVVSDSTGDVKFTDSRINVANITNISAVIQKNNELKISFQSNILGVIPVNGNFGFSMDNKGDKFSAEGHIPSFDAHLLNDVSIPMALIRLNTGTIQSMDFNFTGNDLEAGGKLVMQYNDLKIDVLSRNKKSNSIKKKGLKSLIANIIVKNDNPRNGNLREVNPHFDRDVQKSFFNLIWKTIFT